jgi:hypothetical protein
LNLPFFASAAIPPSSARDLARASQRIPECQSLWQTRQYRFLHSGHSSLRWSWSHTKTNEQPGDGQQLIPSSLPRATTRSKARAWKRAAQALSGAQASTSAPLSGRRQARSGQRTPSESGSPESTAAATRPAAQERQKQCPQNRRRPSARGTPSDRQTAQENEAGARRRAFGGVGCCSSPVRSITSCDSRRRRLGWLAFAALMQAASGEKVRRGKSVYATVAGGGGEVTLLMVTSRYAHRLPKAGRNVRVGGGVAWGPTPRKVEWRRGRGRSPPGSHRAAGGVRCSA